MKFNVTIDFFFSIDELDSSEQFNDFYKHFLLYYGKDQPAMKEHVKRKARERQKTTRTVVKTVKVRNLLP